MNKSIAKIIDSFKFDNIYGIFNAGSKKIKNHTHSRSVDRIWAVPRNKHSKYPPLPEWRRTNSIEHEYFGHPTNDRNYSDHSWNRHCSYCFASSIQFFIEEERKHYKLLRTYVFKILAHISFDNLDRVYENDNDVLPHYRMPTFYHYDDAIRHMKKDRGNLHVLMDELSTKITEFNDAAINANTEINQSISEEIHRAGFDENNQTQLHDINDINRLTRWYLKTEIYHAADVRALALTFNANMGAETLHDLTRNTIINLVRNEHIIERVATVREIQNEIDELLQRIRLQANPISQAISDDHYDIRVDCCPTYWTLLKRFL